MFSQYCYYWCFGAKRRSNGFANKKEHQCGDSRKNGKSMPIGYLA